MSHEHAPTAQVPPRGSIVVYRDGERGDQRRYRLADVVGPVLDDPADGHTWFGVVLPDRLDAVQLVDLAMVVNVAPPD